MNDLGRFPQGEPLVSVLLITYNSQRFVLDTLNSIRNQTYANIELIISDDYSSDQTVTVCEGWVKENADRFSRILLLKANSNTGVSSNCNRALMQAKGEWVKFIAGDDLFTDNSIQDYVTFVRKNANISFLFSLVKCITEDGNEFIHPQFLPHRKFFDLDSSGQYRNLLINNRVFAPTSFIRKKAFDTIGTFDEDIKNIEDYPMWLKATKYGYKLYLVDTVLIKYRVHENSITNNHGKGIKKDLQVLFKKYKLPNISITNSLYLWEDFLFIRSLGSSRKSLIRLLSPVYLSRALRAEYKSILFLAKGA